MRRRRQPEVIAGRVNADGTIAAGDGFTVQKGTAGQYTILGPTGFRLSGATVTPYAVGQAFPRTALVTERSFEVDMQTSAGTATDLAFSFVAVGAP